MGRVRTARCRRRSTSRASPYTGPSRRGRGPRDGQVVLRRGHGRQRAPHVAAGIARRVGHVAVVRRAVHSEAAIRRFLDRHRRRRRPRDGQGSPRRQSPLRPRLRRRALPVGPVGPTDRGAYLSDASTSRRSNDPFGVRADTEILDYRDKYVGGEGMVSAPRELPAVMSDAQAKSLRDYTPGSPRWRPCAASRASTSSPATTNCSSTRSTRFPAHSPSTSSSTHRSRSPRYSVT